MHDCGQSISAEEVDTLLAEGAMGGKLLYAHHAGSADGGEEAAGKLRPMFTSLAYEDELMHKLLARAGGQADPSNSSSPTTSILCMAIAKIETRRNRSNQSM